VPIASSTAGGAWFSDDELELAPLVRQLVDDRGGDAGFHRPMTSGAAR
jgi:hypothetical protein